MINEIDIIEILKSEVVPALGCTEPAAVALAGAAATGGKKNIRRIEVTVSPNIYKNAAAVGIPGIKERGIKAATIIGAVIGDDSMGLQVLNNITEESLKEYYKLMEEDNIDISISDNGENLFIDVILHTDSGNGRCIIKGGHSNIIFLERDGEIVLDSTAQTAKALSIQPREKLMGEGLRDIIEVVKNINTNELEFLFDGAEMNKRVSEFGFDHRSGMAVGASIRDAIEKGLLSDDLYHSVQAYTAAASDARMSGFFVPVMSSAGSGNNGLTAILPVIIAGERLKSDKEEVLRALAISHIVTVYIKNYTGRLSALCSCGVAAGTGAAVAISYLMGGSYEQMEGVINNMVADVAGMICDGAKPGCALKLSTAAGTAVKSAILAMSGSVVPKDNGILGDTCEETIRNLGRVSTPGMIDTDRIILETMMDKIIC